jgi:hypothetical protein
MHYHLTDVQLIIGCFALIIAIFLTMAAVHDLRPKKTQPFRNYFYSDYDGDLLEQSALSDPEEWRTGKQPRLDNFEYSDANSTERLIRVRESNRTHLDRD